MLIFGHEAKELEINKISHSEACLNKDLRSHQQLQSPSLSLHENLATTPVTSPLRPHFEGLRSARNGEAPPTRKILISSVPLCTMYACSGKAFPSSREQEFKTLARVRLYNQLRISAFRTRIQCMHSMSCHEDLESF